MREVKTDELYILGKWFDLRKVKEKQSQPSISFFITWNFNSFVWFSKIFFGLVLQKLCTEIIFNFDFSIYEFVCGFSALFVSTQ